MNSRALLCAASALLALLLGTLAMEAINLPFDAVLQVLRRAAR